MTSHSSRLPVLVVGGGLGGLTMAILLERAGLNYLVFEKSSEVHALGSATNLGPNIQPLFEQLGLFEKLVAISKPSSKVDIFNERMEQIGAINYNEYLSKCGYESRTMSRPDLHRLLLDQVPDSKTLFGKKILRIEQDPEKVTVYCGDGSVYHGSLLIGSDGAYSKVRRSLYEQMEAQGIKVPKTDTQNLTAWHRSILGITDPLDPERYPVVKEPATRYISVIGDNKPNTWRCWTIPGNRICWRMDHHIASSSVAASFSSAPTSMNDPNSRAEWGTEESINSIPETWRSFPMPIGGTMGDLVDMTPPKVISRVVLEEKLYKTWFHGRVVLMGDACHKMLPNSGRGAVNAITDAIVLANALHDCQITHDQSLGNLKAAFKRYYKERYPQAVAELERSKRMARVVAGQTKFDIMVRKVFFALLPKSFKDNSYSAMLRYRPQVKYLPRIQDRGQHLPLSPQSSSSNYFCWRP
ncbi:hypothetical protein EMPS_04370 [Entomortierella parvispora]|uniref:FAD-binding domain-containing protein n=1 Tax=Entomortierella parvispora TaxID=205924 RepID=A0A9P3H8Y9_9FUNG|nr:hypothetical protein EMPS_04370 [Entomortierella parvispora]